jgi:hypothetical protein
MLKKYKIPSFAIILYLFGLTLINVPLVFALELTESVCPKYTTRADGKNKWEESISCYKNLVRSLQEELAATPRIGGRHILQRKNTLFESFPLIDCDTEECWHEAMKLENEKCNKKLWQSGEEGQLSCYEDLIVPLQDELTLRSRERRTSEEVARDAEEMQTQHKGGQVYRNVRCIPKSLGCDAGGYLERPCYFYLLYSQVAERDLYNQIMTACGETLGGYPGDALRAVKELGMHHSMVEDCNKEEKFARRQDEMKVSDMKLPPTTHLSREHYVRKKKSCEIRAACKFFKDAPDHVRALDFSSSAEQPGSMTEMCEVLTTSEVHADSCDNESRPKGTKRYWTCPTLCYTVHDGFLTWHECKTVTEEDAKRAKVASYILFGKEKMEKMDKLMDVRAKWLAGPRESGTPEGTALSERDTIDLGLETPAQRRARFNKIADNCKSTPDSIGCKLHQETWTRDGEKVDEVIPERVGEKVDGVIPERVGEKVDGVIPERVFVPSFRYLGCGFTLPCTSVWWSFEHNAPVERREVPAAEARITEEDNWVMWAGCIFVSLIENTIEGTNFTCVHTDTAQ